MELYEFILSFFSSSPCCSMLKGCCKSSVQSMAETAEIDMNDFIYVSLANKVSLFNTNIISVYIKVRQKSTQVVIRNKCDLALLQTITTTSSLLVLITFKLFQACISQLNFQEIVHGAYLNNNDHLKSFQLVTKRLRKMTTILTSQQLWLKLMITLCNNHS